MVKVTTFFDILSKGMKAGQFPAKTTTAINWYREKAKEVSSVNRKKFIANQSDPRQQRGGGRAGIEVGSMYIYNYDPKHKATLEVYDTHPIVIPFTVLGDRFYGCNFHYLPPPLRAQLMDVLHSIRNNDAYDATTKLKITYQVLKAIAKKKLYEPTIHCYLKRHIKSKVMYVYPQEWDQAIFLPLAKFRGPKAADYKGH